MLVFHLLHHEEQESWRHALEVGREAHSIAYES